MKRGFHSSLGGRPAAIAFLSGRRLHCGLVFPSRTLNYGYSGNYPVPYLFIASSRESRRGALDEAEAARRLGRRAFTGPADARVPGEVVAFVEEAAEALGGLDLLVNNVGVFRRVPLDEMSEEILDEAFDVNVKATVMACRAAAPHMRQRGGGAIINLASLGGLRPWPSHLAYCASTAAPGSTSVATIKKNERAIMGPL